MTSVYKHTNRLNKENKLVRKLRDENCERERLRKNEEIRKKRKNKQESQNYPLDN